MDTFFAFFLIWGARTNLGRLWGGFRESLGSFGEGLGSFGGSLGMLWEEFGETFGDLGALGGF